MLWAYGIWLAFQVFEVLGTPILPPKGPYTGENPDNLVEIGDIWPSGDYCIMPGLSGKCPMGFQIGHVSLSVPISVGPREVYANGNNTYESYVKIGRMGGLDLTIHPFDNLYLLKLTACCHVLPQQTVPEAPKESEKVEPVAGDIPSVSDIVAAALVPMLPPMTATEVPFART